MNEVCAAFPWAPGDSLSPGPREQNLPAVGGGLQLGSIEQSSWVAPPTSASVSRASLVFSGVLPGNKLGLWGG